MTDHPTPADWLSGGIPQSDDPKVLAKRRLAAAIRRIIERLPQTDAPAGELSVAADAAEAFGDRLDALLPERRWLYEGASETAVAGNPSMFFDRSPIIGLANPLAPPVRMEVVGSGEDRHVEGKATFTAAYEGPPNSVHGGFVACAFDEVLGMAQSLSGSIGMTGTLTIVYRSPTPLYEEVRFRGWHDRVEGRKIFVKGSLHAGERLCAEADGIFISVDVSKFMTMMSERDQRPPS